MSKSLILRPSILILSPYFLATTAAAIATPIFGFSTPSLVVLGLCVWITLIKVRQLPKEYYIVSDNSIQVRTTKDDTTVSLVSITNVASRAHWQLPFSSYGQVVITANDRRFVMRGIKGATSTADIIRQAVEAAIARERRRSSPPKFNPPLHAPGTLEQMNDLVGLWQQGILTDEEYEMEMSRIKK
jgi:hypothetical protein